MGRLPRAWVPPIAGQQLGVFTVAQAVAAGATYEQARRRRESGEWHRIAGDAFAAASTGRTPWTDVVAAALTWPDGVVCLASAARFHRLPLGDDADDDVHVLVPGRRRARHRLQPHRFAVPPIDVVPAGIGRVTSVRRTVLDCLGRLEEGQAQSLLAWAVSREVVVAEDVAEHLERHRGAWGNVARRRAHTDLEAGALSAAERRLHGVLRAAGIAGWSADTRVFDRDGLIGRADVLFRDERLVVEVDGFAFHSDRQSFVKDRRRQNRLVAAGWTVLRFTWADLVERPDGVVAEIRVMLARLGARQSRTT